MTKDQNDTETKAIIRKKPETVLKKRRMNLENERKRLQRSDAIHKKRQQTKKLIFRRAEKYARQHLQKEKNFILAKKLAKAHRSFYVEPQVKLAFVVRIKGIKGAIPKVKKVLQLLRLRQTNSGAFVRLNKATINLLRLVEPYVTWGYPTLQNVRDLIYKRGHARVNGNRMAITGNAIIEKELAKYDLLSVEDVVDELWKLGTHFVEVNNFLWPFKLRAPKEEYENVKKSFVQGGAFGDRGDSMPDLIQKML